MPETFLILLAGGVMLAAAISDPHAVTLLWLRLCGIIALSLTGLSLFFCSKAEQYDLLHRISPLALMAYGPMFVCVLAQLAASQIPVRRVQRVFALLGFVASVVAGDLVLRRNSASYEMGRPADLLALAGISAMTGLVLMDMLLGHAYLTASKMSMKPFARLNLALAVVAGMRLISATAGVWWINSRHPIKMLFDIHGLLMLTRWLVGLALPFVFIYMAHDCIKRRATQSATGILYVCGILIFIGEMIALPLLRDTGLPF